MHLGLGLVHIGANAGKAFEIGADIGRGLVLRNRELIGQAKAGYAVDNSKIDRLGLTPDHGVHALDRHAKHFRRGHGMNIQPLGKGLFQLWNIAHMRQEP